MYLINWIGIRKQSPLLPFLALFSSFKRKKWINTLHFKSITAVVIFLRYSALDTNIYYLFLA